MLSVDPPMYGRSAAGVSSTAAIHHPAETTIASAAASSCRTRRQNGTGAATRYASPNAGTLSTASPLLVRNPNPNATPAPTSHQVRPCSSARVTQYAATTTSSTMNASGLSNRKMRTAAGVSAIAAPAISPAAAPARPPARPRTARRTVAHSSPAAATPSSACGTSSDQLLKPKIRPDSPMTQSDAGGLSTVMKFEESSEPKNHAFQFSVPACTAAA